MIKYKISAIVPIYNGSKFVKNCVEQLVGQTLNEIEIILVDDGSTDNTWEICASLAKKYDACKVIHQENKGVSVARNTGLKIACGKYVMFFDVDDCYDVDICESLYCCAEETGTQIVCYTNNQLGYSTISLSRNEALKFLLYGDLGMSSCGKIYLREILPTDLFPKGKKIYEDFKGLFLAICAADRIGCINGEKYHYIHYENSSSRAPAFTEKYFDAIDITDEICNSVKNISSNLIPYAQARRVKAYLRIIKIYYIRGAPNEHAEKIQELKRYLKSLSRKEVYFCLRKKTEILRYYLCLYLFPVFKIMIKTVDRN